MANCCTFRSVQWQVVPQFAEQFEQRSRASLEKKHRKLKLADAPDSAATCQNTAMPDVPPPTLFTPPPQPSADTDSSYRWITVFCRGNQPSGQYRGQWIADCGKEHKHSSACDRQHGVGDFKNDKTQLYYSGEWQHGKYHHITRPALAPLHCWTRQHQSWLTVCPDRVLNALGFMDGAVMRRQLSPTTVSSCKALCAAAV